MELPKFLMADNMEYPENAYIVHTLKPCFILDIDTDEYKIMDGSVADDLEMAGLIEQAYEFYENELDKYDDEDEA